MVYQADVAEVVDQVTVTCREAVTPRISPQPPSAASMAAAALSAESTITRRTVIGGP